MKVSLAAVLKTPVICQDFNGHDWSQLISFGRSHGVLGRLYYLLESEGLIANIPQGPLNHLKSAFLFANQQQKNTIRELNEIAAAFKSRGLTPVILKGAAYLLSRKRCAEGRTFNDIDVLTYKDTLQSAEIALMVAGWIHKKEEEYDKEYYRNWTHEIQPMIHNNRLTVVDLHHNILPPTNKFSFDAKRLKLKVNETKNLATLDDCDMFIHCALHLFTEGEFSKPLRDLTDLSMLLDDLDSNTTVDLIWARAVELGVQSFIALALTLALPLTNNKIVIPVSVKLTFIQRYLVLPCYRKVLLNNNVVTTTLSHKIASTFLYIRGHFVRMPIKILLPHLIKKWLKRTKNESSFGKDWA